MGRPIRLSRDFVARWRTTAARAKTPAAGPLISVVVPAYNEERHLEQCLRSVALQNYRAFECIVVDDASQDRTTSIVGMFAGRDPRFRLMSHAGNKGLAAARNSGARVAGGAFITFLDGDDYLYQNALADRAATLDGVDDERVAGSFAGIHSVPEGGRWSDRIMPYLLHRREAVTFLSRAGESPFPVHAPMIRADIFEKFGGFDESMRDGCEDWDFWQRILRAGYRFVPTHTVGGAYRMRQGSMRLDKAAKHSLVAAGLLARAYRASGPEEPRAFFHEPLGHYLGEAARIRRLIRGVTLASIDGDEAGRLHCLSELPANAVWPLWVIDVAEEVSANLYLYCAGHRGRLAKFSPKGEAITREITDVLC